MSKVSTRQNVNQFTLPGFLCTEKCELILGPYNLPFLVKREVRDAGICPVGEMRWTQFNSITFISFAVKSDCQQ